MGNIPNVSPSVQIYGELDQAYNFFNREIFDGRLPACMFILDRAKRRYGHFMPEGYELRPKDELEDSQWVDEIGLNAEAMRGRPDFETLSTLVHEQAHLWQKHFGSKFPKRPYHNKEWAGKMEEIGLMPSSTGMPDGKKTGRLVSHYIIAGGVFSRTCQALLDTGFRLSWQSLPIPRTAASESGKMYKYECPECEQKVRGKKGGHVLCGDCSTPKHMVKMLCDSPDGDEDEGDDDL